MTQLPSILYVEDDPDIQAIAMMSLETVGGFGVQAVDGGPQALEIAGKQMPGLLILDVMMPGMDGPATLDAIRKLPGGPEVPVIFMTAKVQQSEVASLQKPGVIGVIPKPFDPMTLPETVRSIWNKHMEAKNAK